MYIDSVLRNREDMGLELESMGFGLDGRDSPSLHSERGVVTLIFNFCVGFFSCFIGGNGKRISAWLKMR